MLETTSTRPLRREFRGALFQGVAIAVCVLLGLAMIVNTQLGGEAMWFWYATLSTTAGSCIPVSTLHFSRFSFWRPERALSADWVV